MLTVSVVIPTLDRPNLLLRALRSVFNQTYPYCSTSLWWSIWPSEETMSALRAIEDPRLRVIINPRPVNAPAARNVGADHAKGDWIAFLDDDDEWLPEKIEKQLSFGLRRRGAGELPQPDRHAPFLVCPAAEDLRQRDQAGRIPVRPSLGACRGGISCKPPAS